MYNKTIRVKTKKGMGDIVATLYRHLLASQTEAWTPVAFHVGSSNDQKTTLLKAEINTTTDMIQVLSSLLGCTYSINSSLVGDKNIVAISIPVKGKACVKDLEKSQNIAPDILKVNGRGRDVVLFELGDENIVNLTVIFVKQCGDMTKEQYRELIDNSPDINIPQENLSIIDSTPNIYSSIRAEVVQEALNDLVIIHAVANMELDADFFTKINDDLVKTISSATLEEVQ